MQYVPGPCNYWISGWWTCFKKGLENHSELLGSAGLQASDLKVWYWCLQRRDSHTAKWAEWQKAHSRLMTLWLTPGNLLSASIRTSSEYNTWWPCQWSNSHFNCIWEFIISYCVGLMTGIVFCQKYDCQNKSDFSLYNPVKWQAHLELHFVKWINFAVQLIPILINWTFQKFGESYSNYIITLKNT